MHTQAGPGCFSQRDQVGMVCQIDHLAKSGHLRQRLERGMGPAVIEGLQNIVSDERRRRPLFGDLVIARDPKR